MDLLEGEYEPASDSEFNWAAQQVQAYEASGGQEANTLPDHPEWPIVVVTSRGAKSGSVAARANLFQGHTSWQSSQP